MTFALRVGLSVPPPAESSKDVAARVANARARQLARFKNTGGEHPIRTNAAGDGWLLEDIAAPDAKGRKLLAEEAERLYLTARGDHRVRRVHIAEAVSYRRVMPGRNNDLLPTVNLERTPSKA